MDRYRDPDRNIGRGYVNTGEYRAVPHGLRSWTTPSQTNRLDISSRPESRRKALVLIRRLHSGSGQYGCGTLRRSINLSPAVKAGGSCVGWAGAVARSVPKPSRKPEERPR